MNALSIVQVTGKQQRIRGAIEMALKDWPPYAELPNYLQLTQEQYEMIKKCRNLGAKGTWRGANPEDRIYVSRYNAMQLHIKDAPKLLQA